MRSTLGDEDAKRFEDDDQEDRVEEAVAAADQRVHELVRDC